MDFKFFNQTTDDILSSPRSQFKFKKITSLPAKNIFKFTKQMCLKSIKILLNELSS